MVKAGKGKEPPDKSTAAIMESILQVTNCQCWPGGGGGGEGEPWSSWFQFNSVLRENLIFKDSSWKRLNWLILTLLPLRCPGWGGIPGLQDHVNTSTSAQSQSHATSDKIDKAVCSYKSLSSVASVLAAQNTKHDSLFSSGCWKFQVEFFVWNDFWQTFLLILT